MIIKKEKTLYHLYALESDFSQDLVSYCVYLKQTLGWKEFQWDIESKKWRFKDPAIISMIKGKFKDLVYDEDIAKDLERFEAISLTEAKREERALEIKEANKATIDIKNVKGNLYEYQKIGIEFLVNSGGRALLADAPGCIDGDMEIVVNRGGCAKKIKMRDLYLKNKGDGWRKCVKSRIRSLSPDGLFHLNEVEEVVYQGVKKVLEIKMKTDEGKIYTLRATPDHKIAVPDGWMEMGDIRKGQEVIVNGDKTKWCDVCKSNTSYVSSEYCRKYRPKNYGKCKKCVYRFVRDNGRKDEVLDKDGYVMISGLYFHPKNIGKINRKRLENTS